MNADSNSQRGAFRRALPWALGAVCMCVVSGGWALALPFVFAVSAVPSGIVYAAVRHVHGDSDGAKNVLQWTAVFLVVPIGTYAGVQLNDAVACYRASRVARAVEAYEWDHGTRPDRLAKLSPDYAWLPTVGAASRDHVLDRFGDRIVWGGEVTLYNPRNDSDSVTVPYHDYVEIDEGRCREVEAEDRF